jgi:hypothetical protein
MGQVELKMLGVGPAAAILLDATIVRGVLLPAAMTLLGDRCWYLPGRTPITPGTPGNGRPAGTLQAEEKVMNGTIMMDATGNQPRTGTGQPGAPSLPDGA